MHMYSSPTHIRHLNLPLYWRYLLQCINNTLQVHRIVSLWGHTVHSQMKGETLQWRTSNWTLYYTMYSAPGTHYLILPPKTPHKQGQLTNIISVPQIRPLSWNKVRRSASSVVVSLSQRLNTYLQLVEYCPTHVWGATTFLTNYHSYYKAT